MVNSYYKYKVESLKAERYTLQSLNPMHQKSAKIGSISALPIPIETCLQEVITIWDCWCHCIVYDHTGHMEGTFLYMEWHLNYLSKVSSSEL